MNEPLYNDAIWVAFAAAAIAKPDVSMPEAATNADLMLEEFHRRFVWVNDGWQLKPKEKEKS
jgi:hypothetical protein